jgi:hypothetical protein
LEDDDARLAKVGPPCVGEQAFETIEEISPTAFDQTLGDSVLPRARDRGAHSSDAERSDRYRDFKSELRVPVKDLRAIAA